MDFGEVIVIFSWELTYFGNLGDRYNDDPDWNDIVDFSNDKQTVDDEISDFIENVLTSDDNVLVWFPRNHGAGDTDSEYADNFTSWILNGLSQFYFTENPIYYELPQLNIYDIFKFEESNGEKKYKRVKYLFSACYSGHLLVGNKTFMNGGDQTADDCTETIAMTSAKWDSLGHKANRKPGVEHEYHSGFNYGIYVTNMGEDPWGNTFSFSSDPDVNNDNVLSMAELYNNIAENGASELEDISWFEQPDALDNGSPQIGDPCPRADYYYLYEHLKLQDASLSLIEGENIRYYRVDDITAGNGGTSGNDLTIPNSSNIEFVVDSFVKLTDGFKASKGSKFLARIGEIECP